ncbi:MAG: hypothetical protein IJM55_06650 [Ruminococcus sp.]|nr:hypothetical protein [Ruminococcus sp.]
MTGPEPCIEFEMKISRMLVPCLFAAGTLSGCTFGSSIDNLMAPPKLSMEQEQIYSALTDATGTSISLKYPKSGKYLSAFIVDDIDGDGVNEAVVFYERNGLGVEENTLRINILDQYDGKWRSVCDTAAEGAEIEKVIISKLGSNDRVNLIIGSSLINRSEKNVTIYSYDPGEEHISSDFSGSCSFIDVTDLDSDGENEFLLLAGSAGGTPATAEVYKLDSGGTYHHYKTDLSGSFTEFDSLSYGDVSGGRRGLYIDAASGSGTIQTDIIYMDNTGLCKVFGTAEESSATVRLAGCSSRDIDGDGVLEIPVQTIAPGYEEVPESEQMKMTQWKFVSKDNRLVQKYSSYYSLGNGYIFVFPEKWQNRVTVRRDAVNDEIVFCEYTDGSAGRELMRIYCAEDAPSREDRLFNGYMLMGTKGEYSYLAYIPQGTGEGDELIPTAGDAAVGFRLI